MQAARGGEEARLFTKDLLRMYQRHAAKQGWKVEVVEKSANVRRAALLIRGEGVMSLLQEAGEHIVQRKTKSRRADRIHTSSAWVSVSEIQTTSHSLKEDEIQVETMRGSGPGGQHRNKTESAVRLTHTPTGIQAFADMRSQHRSREIAFQILASRLEEAHIRREREKRQKHKASQRNVLRTYDFVRGMIRDKAGGKTRKIDQVMNGDFSTLPT